MALSRLLLNYIVALCMLAFADPCRGRAAASDAPANVLAEFNVPLGGDLIMVPISVGGKPYQFLLDTGCTCTFFNERHRQLLGEPRGMGRGRFVGGHRPLELFTAPPMMLASLPLRSDNYVATMDLAAAEHHTGRPIDGCLGMDVLRHFVLTIDFDAGKVRILDSAVGAPGRATPIIWHEQPRMREGPFIAARINGNLPCEFLLDTGAVLSTSATMDLSQFDALVTAGSISPLAKSRRPESPLKTTGAARGRLGSLEVAGYKHEGATVARYAFWNALGVRFFSRYITTFDFPNSVVYLSPGRRFNEPDSSNRSGIYVDRQNGEIVVRKVRIASPGHVGGVMPDDVILEVDGETTRGCSSVSNLARVLAARSAHAPRAAERK